MPPYDPQVSLQLATALRESGLPAEVVTAALTQSRLRAKAREKFGDLAADMLFTADGLEQATRLTLAARHAQRFRAADIELVADLGCGIGGDAMALAGLDISVLAVEKDPATALVASVNLRQLPEATVRRADAFDVDLLGMQGAWADPARRSRGRRTFRMADYSPAVDRLFALREEMALGMKLGPGIPHREIPADAFAQWVTFGGEVLEADVWFGKLAPEGPGRGAMILGRDGATHQMSEPGNPQGPVRQTHSGPIGGYVYEVDGAVMRAGLVHRVAAELSGHLLDPTIAFITTEKPKSTVWATGFRVLDVVPFAIKGLRSYLRARSVGTLEIKKRGADVDPAKLRGQLALKGPNSATIIITRIAGEHRVLVVERLGKG